MNELRLVLRPARVSLIALCLALGACLSLILFFRHGHEQVRIELISAQLDLAKVQTSLRERQSDLTLLQTHIQRFHQLAGRGLLGPPDRTAWVEQLLESHRRRGLPASLSYTLHSPVPATPRAPSAASSGHEVVHGTRPDEALFHELEFKLQGVHEEELLNLLQDFERRASGRFRVNFCQLSERTQQGLTAQCKLRFFTLPWAPGAGSASSASAVAVPKSQPAYTAHLATLFYSPSEREAIVRDRIGDASAGLDQRLRVTGIVKRDRGHSTAWINHQAVAEGQSLPPMRDTTIAASTVTVDGERLRVGETLDLRTRERSDVVDSAALRVKGRDQ
jgi:hypothetical protein